MDTIRHTRSVPDVLADLVNQFTTLFRKEMHLARAEVSEKITQATWGIALIGCGAILLIPAVVVLLNAAVDAIIESGLASYWADLIVGGAALIVGIVLALIGVNRLKAHKLAPTRTVGQIQRDAAVAREQVTS